MQMDALKWAVNLTSRGTKIVPPVDVSGGKGLIFRVDRRDYLWPTDAVAAIKAGDPITRPDIMRARRHLVRDPLIDKALMSAMPSDYFVEQAMNWNGYQKLLNIPDDQVQALNGHAWQLRLTAQYRGRSRYPTGKFYMPESKADAAHFNREVVHMATPPVNQVAGRLPTGPFTEVLMSLNYEKDPARVKQADNQQANICPLAGVQGVADALRGDPVSFDVVGKLPNGLVGFTRFNKEGKTDDEIKQKGPMFCISCHMNHSGVFPFADESEKYITGTLGMRGLDENTKVGIRNLYGGEAEKERVMRTFRDAFKASRAQLGLDDMPHSAFDKADFKPATQAGYAGAYYSEGGKQPPVYVAEDKIRNNPWISRIAAMAGTTEQVIREIIRRDPELTKVVGFQRPEAITELKPDQFRAAFPKIMVAVPFTDKELRGAQSPYMDAMPGGRRR